VRLTPPVRLEEDGRSTNNRWALAIAARCRAVLLAADGDVKKGVEACENSLEHHAFLSMPFELARTLLVYGMLQWRSKLKRPARATLERASVIFGELGARVWVERARAELGRIGGRQPTASGALTATEQRVAELAAAGRTNRQIAAELYLSERTVEANLTKVYRKLGMRSRAELAGSWTREIAL
jgi:DNA-binding CsgD family transcriptional regulator